MLGMLGIAIGLAVLIIGAYRSWHIFTISLVGSLIIAVFCDLGIWDAFAKNYASGLTGWVGTYFLIFAFGALFGEIMAVSGAAKSVAYTISDKIGARNAPYALALITLLLTFGGINAFVVAFTLYPLGIAMLKEANLPRYFLATAWIYGVATITMACLPGSPSTQNLVPTQYLGTSTMAAPGLGLLIALFYLVAGFSFLRWMLVRAGKTGEHFVAIAQDGLGDAREDRTKLPNFTLSVLPLFAVIALILFLTAYSKLSAFAIVSLGLLFGCMLSFAFFFNKIPDKKSAIDKGLASSVNPLINTAAILGFGAVIQATPAFAFLVEFVKNMTMNPYAIISIGTNLLAGVSGSSVGGLKIFLSSTADHFLKMGVSPEAIHRLSAIASGGLDSLPHNSAIVSMMAIFGTTHKESYKYIFIISVIMPLIGTILAVFLCSFMYPIG